MINWEERKKEIRLALNDVLCIENCPHCTADVDLIISQEQSMIEKECKEAVREFAKECYNSLEGYEKNEYLKSTINNLLTELNIENI